MGKFYITIYTKIKPFNLKSKIDKEFTDIISADNELQACVKTWLKMRIGIDDSTWKVSELGFENHDDDIFFNGPEVKKAIANYQKKRGDSS